MGLNMPTILGRKILQNEVNPSNTTAIMLTVDLNFAGKISKTGQTRQSKYSLSLISIALYNILQITLRRSFYFCLCFFHPIPAASGWNVPKFTHFLIETQIFSFFQVFWGTGGTNQNCFLRKCHAKFRDCAHTSNQNPIFIKTIF